jgi:hypothetical protein
MWHVAMNGQSQGPYGAEQVASGIAAGQITPATLVWTAGMANWAAAGQVPQLAGAFGPPARGSSAPAFGPARRRSTRCRLALGGDAHFEVRIAHVLKLAAIIRRLRPEIVLAPTLEGDQHPDHVALGRVARDAARLARFGGLAGLRGAPHAIGQLFHYAVTPDAEPAGGGRIVVDVSAPEVVAAWTAAMNAHASQLRTRNYVELQLARARVLGLRAGVEHAQALFPASAPLVAGLDGLTRAARRF